MSGCSGCSVGNEYNSGGNYVGIRLNENEDGRVVFCETAGEKLDKYDWIVVESSENGAFEYAQVTSLHPLISKGCQLKNARKLIRVATDADLDSHRPQIDREK